MFERLNENHESHSKEPILNEWDKNLLAKGALGVMEHLQKDFSGDFPDFIILPETCPRALPSLFSPLFEKAKMEGKKRPQFLYLNINKKPGYIQRYLERDKGVEIKSEEELRDAASSLGPIKHPSGAYLDYSKIQTLLKEAAVEEVAEGRVIAQERAEEITKWISRHPNATMAILDDFVRTEKTFDEVKRAFGGRKINAYALCSGNDPETASNPKYEVKVGHYLSKEEWDGNPSRDHKLLFSFDEDQDALGVTKNEKSKYALVQKGETDEHQKTIIMKKKELRKELRALGEEIAKTMPHK